MSDEKRDVPWVVVSPDFNQNVSKFSYQELVKFAGQHVAWNLEGTRIVAHGVALDEAVAMLVAAGGDPQRVVWEWFPPEAEWSQGNL
jgi:hypothetical protein